MPFLPFILGDQVFDLLESSFDTFLGVQSVLAGLLLNLQSCGHCHTGLRVIVSGTLREGTVNNCPIGMRDQVFELSHLRVDSCIGVGDNIWASVDVVCHLFWDGLLHRRQIHQIYQILLIQLYTAFSKRTTDVEAIVFLLGHCCSFLRSLLFGYLAFFLTAVAVIAVHFVYLVELRRDSLNLSPSFLDFLGVLISEVA